MRKLAYSILQSFLPNSIMLASFHSDFLRDFPMEHGHSVSSIKYGWKLFMADLGQIVQGKFIGVLFHMEG